MRITVFGAFGSVGARTVEEARRRGHDVTAVSRRARPGAEVGDARVVDDVVRLSEDGDLVISATRPVPGAEPELVAAARSLLAGTAKAGVRLLLVGGAATLRTAHGYTVEEAPGFPDELRPIARACAEQLVVCRADTDADWTYLIPPSYLVPGERTGVFEVGRDDEMGTTISLEDFAVALLDEAETPRHPRARFTVAY